MTIKTGDNLKPPTRFRWVILGLLFAATTILYIDRSALGIMAPELQNTIGWSEAQYGIINSVFMIAYAACFILTGKWIYLMGTRRGYLASIGMPGAELRLMSPEFKKVGG